MKRFLTCVTVAFVLMFAVSVLAQDGSTVSSPVPPLATLGPVVGKMVSAYSYSGIAYNVTTSPTTVVSAPVPSKYKSKTQWLIAHVTLQEVCTGDFIVSGAAVDGANMYPSDIGAGAYQCADNAGYEPRHVTYFLPPESLGGPAIAPGATVSVQVNSGLGTARIAFGSILVQAVK
jgi:hypothetical protein